MIVTRALAAAAFVALAAVVPYLARSEITHARRADELRGAYVREETLRIARHAEFSAQLAAAQDEERTLDPRVLELQRQRHERSSNADVAESRALAAEQALTAAEQENRELHHRIGFARTESDELAQRRREQERAVIAREAEVERLRSLEVESRDRRVTFEAETERLRREREQWESLRSRNRLPRTSLLALAGVSDDGAATGIEAGMWLARPLGQRVGVIGGLLIEDRYQRAERAFFAPAWQGLLWERWSIDVFAGTSWLAADGTEFGGAFGATFARALRSLPISVGVSGVVLPKAATLGLVFGYSQARESIDPYAR